MNKEQYGGIAPKRLDGRTPPHYRRCRYHSKGLRDTFRNSFSYYLIFIALLSSVCIEGENSIDLGAVGKSYFTNRDFIPSLKNYKKRVERIVGYHTHIDVLQY